MLAEWYLRRQLEQRSSVAAGGIADEKALLIVARLKQLIVPSTAFFYSGTPVVRQFFAVQDQTLATKQRVLQLAGSLAKGSDQESFRAIVQAAKEGPEPLREMETDAISENGILGKLDRTWFLLGDEACMQQEQIELGVTIQTLAQQFEIDGKYTLFLAQKHPKRLLGIFACEYQLHPQAMVTVGALQSLGLEVVLLTGSRTRLARGIAGQVGISLIHSELEERDKTPIITTLQKQQPYTAVLARAQLELPDYVPTISVGRHALGSLAWVPSFEKLPALIESAQDILRTTQKRLFWCKL